MLLTNQPPINDTGETSNNLTDKFEGILTFQEFKRRNEVEDNKTDQKP
jgi:hypothetical protein